MALFASGGPSKPRKRVAGLLRHVPGGKCWLCGGNVDRKERRRAHPASPSVDHVKPLSKGGTHKHSNLKLAHVYCNAVRSSSEEPRDQDDQRVMAAKLEKAIRRWVRRNIPGFYT